MIPPDMRAYNLVIAFDSLANDIRIVGDIADELEKPELSSRLNTMLATASTGRQQRPDALRWMPTRARRPPARTTHTFSKPRRVSS